MTGEENVFISLIFWAMLILFIFAFQLNIWDENLNNGIAVFMVYTI